MADSLRPPRTAARQASLSITNSRSLLKLRSIELMMPSNHLVLCRPLLLLPSIIPSMCVCVYIYMYIYSLLHILFHYGLSQDTKNSSLCPTGRPCCL